MYTRNLSQKHTESLSPLTFMEYDNNYNNLKKNCRNRMARFYEHPVFKIYSPDHLKNRVYPLRGQAYSHRDQSVGYNF